MGNFKEQKIDELFSIADNLNGLFGNAYQLALKNGCPNVLKQELYENTDLLQNTLFRIAQFIAMPEAEEFNPYIQQKADSAEHKLKLAFVE